MTSGWCLVVMLGCSYHTPSDSSETPSDAPGVGEDVASDGPGFMGPTASACVAKWLQGGIALSAPAMLLGGVSSNADDRDPFLSADELRIYFTSPGPQNIDVFTLTRTSVTATTFNNNATIVASLSDALTGDGKVSMTGDELTAILSSSRAGGQGGGDFWQASRATAGATAFGAASESQMGTVNDAGEQRDPAISPDGLRLYFAAGSAPQNLAVASRTNTLSSFSAGVAIPVVGDPSGDADPTLTADERVLVFSSNRSGGAGGTDLWYSVRAERDRPFSTPVLVPNVNSTTNDGDPHLSQDGCRLYLASDRQNDFDIYQSTLQ